MSEKKEYTPKEVAEGILARAKELAKSQLQKAEMSIKEAAKEIKGDKKVNEVLPQVAPDKRDDVLKELRMDKADPRNQNSAQMAEVKIPQPSAPEGQPKAIAKQPLQLKKFMDKCAMKKSSDWKQHPGPSKKDWAPDRKQPEPTEKERKEFNDKMIQTLKDKDKKKEGK